MMQMGEMDEVLFDSSNNKETLSYLDRYQESEKKRKNLKDLLYEIPVGIAVIKGGTDFSIISANQKFYQITGYQVYDMGNCGGRISELLYKEDYGLFEDAVERCRGKKTSGEFEARIRTKNGELRWGIFQCQLYFYKNALPYYLLTCWDITARRELEDEIHLLDEKYHLLEEVTDELIFDVDVQKNQFRIPVQYRKYTPDGKQEYADIQNLYSEIYEEDRAQFQKAMKMASEKECHGSIEYRLRQENNGKISYRWFRTNYRSLPGHNQNIIRILGRSYDISADREIQERLSEEMRLDPLTRILNKIASRESVDSALRETAEGTHVLFVIDVDNFKRINDTFGHTVGDMVLSDIAMLIQEHFRATDIVGRVGGDEFMVLMRNTTLEDAKAKAEELCQNVQKKLSGDGAVIMVTLSVGMSIAGQDGNDYKSLFENADHAMYHVKKSGKNDFGFARTESRQDCDRRNRLEENEFRKKQNADKEFLNLAFSLLAHARDINGSLNVLLEQIGKKYNLSMVSVFEFEDNSENMLLTNCWSDLGQIYEKNVLQRTWKEFEHVGIGEFTQMDGKECVLENWTTEREQIQSAAAVKFEFSNGKTGCMIIGSSEPGKNWNQKEINTICELSRVVSVFVTLRNKIKEDQRAIHTLKYRDKLTGLYNLDAFRRKVEEILKEKNPEKTYAIISLDVNNFSYVNENFGPRVGDNILNELANLLIESAKALVACRMYSDYFMVLFCADSREEIVDTIKEGNQKFEERQQEKYPAGSLKLSTGISFDVEQVTFETMLESANLARKSAKERGISTGVVYDEGMRKKRDEQVQIASRFYGAIQKGEFEIFLQPKFLLEEKKIYGAESLARWRTDAGEYIAPDRFIPALESMGYVMDLDFYMFEQLLKTMKRWKDAGKQLFTISTNFSRRNFENGGEAFLERLLDIFGKYQIDPSYIEIEVTEGVVVENLENLNRCLETLAKIGFRIAIDDFGTGYSSLNVLFEIPADVIKIDKSFTGKVSMDQEKDFVEKMGQLIRAAKEEVVFEGIETEEQLEILKNCGFRYGQGYLFDKPLPVSVFERKYM